MLLKKVLFTVLIAILVILPFATPRASTVLETGPDPSENSVYSSPSPTGIIIPLYTYPTSSTWSEVIQAKIKFPAVPIVAVINPASGPGTSPDPNYAAGINSLENAGVTVLGYVHTSWGTRNISTVESEVKDYQLWYNVSGIFFDEMASVAGYESYYSTLNNYSKNLGFKMTVGNPGSTVAPSYVGTLDTLCIYENTGFPSMPLLQNSTKGGGKQNFAAISYNVLNLSATFQTEASGYVGWEYITTGQPPNPYDSLPSYFQSEVSNLASEDIPLAKEVSLSVQSLNTSGDEITGPWATIASLNGSILAAGYTPINFTAEAGSTLLVTMSSSSAYEFSRWNDGSSVPSMALTLTGPVTLSAYYNTNISATNSTTLTVTSTRTNTANITSANPTTVSETSVVTDFQPSQPVNVPASAQAAGVVLLFCWVLLIASKKMR